MGRLLDRLLRSGSSEGGLPSTGWQEKESLAAPEHLDQNACKTHVPQVPIIALANRFACSFFFCICLISVVLHMFAAAHVRGRLSLFPSRNICYCCARARASAQNIFRGAQQGAAGHYAVSLRGQSVRISLNLREHPAFSTAPLARPHVPPHMVVLPDSSFRDT